MASNNAENPNPTNNNSSGNNNSENNNDNNDSKPRIVLPTFVHVLNTTLMAHPMHSCVAFIGVNYACFGVFFSIFNSVGFNFPALAAGFAVGGVIKRFRLPLDIALTSFVARMFPMLAEIKVGALLQPPTPANVPQDQQFKPRVLQMLENAANKYGAAFLVERAVLGLCTCAAFTTLFHHGLDLPSLLGNILGNNEQLTRVVGSTSSAMALAGVCNTLCLPVKIAAVPFLVSQVVRAKGKAKGE